MNILGENSSKKGIRLKLLKPLALALAVSLFLTACVKGGGEEAAKGQAGNAQTIVFAGININPHVTIWAEEFNGSQTEYKVEIKDYGMYEEPEEKLDLDIIWGNVPDIIDLAYLDYRKYIKKGLLCDLNSFLQKDSELTKEMFFENIVSAMEVDGGLYYLSPFFTVGGLVGRTEDASQSLTLSELIEQEQKYGGDARAFYHSNEGVLQMLTEADAESFIDWENGVCHFDGEEWKQILQYSMNYADAESVMHDTDSRVEKMRSHKILYEDLSGTSDFLSVLEYKAVFGEKLGVIGYPSARKRGGSIEPAMHSFSLGICEASSGKEGAWEFLKSLLSEEYCIDQTEEYYTDGFPIRKDVFEALCKKYTTREAYVDKFGHSIEPADGIIVILH